MPDEDLDQRDDRGDAQDGGDRDDAQDGGRRDDPLSHEDARRLRSEARNLRQRLRATEAERDRLRTESLPDQERQAQELTTTRSERDTLRAEVRELRAQVIAQRLGIVDPEAAARLLDLRALGDDADDPRALERELKELKRQRPWLAGTAGGSRDGDDRGADGGAGRGRRDDGTVDMNELLFGAARRR